MPARTFEDSTGATWEVFEVRRASQKPGAVSAGLEQGWLAFVCGDEKRRLAPFPAEWASCPESELERLCARARVGVTRPSTPGQRTSLPAIAAIGGATLAEAIAARDSAPRAVIREQEGEPLPSSGDDAAVEDAVRRFAHEARTTGLAAIEAMVRLRSTLAERFPGSDHAARDMRSVRRWFVEAYYFERDA